MFSMKEQLKSVILPKLPIVGHLKLSTKDGKTLYSIEVVKKSDPDYLDPFFEMCYWEFFEFLTGNTNQISIPLDYSVVTPFQRKVMKVMKKISYGKVATYKDLAEKLQTRGFQAIGTACGRNPFILIYPCHRVVGTKNEGGFAHGLRMKRELLKLEGHTL
jgi:O-6-methylguanine DNA methyltransferase